MWIMLVVAMNLHCDEGNIACQARQNSSPSVTSVEFSSRDRCIRAVQFTLKRSKIQDAFCVQK